MKHIHVSAVQGLVIFLFVIVFAFFWRVASAKLTEKGSPFGPAMDFIL